VLAVREKPKTSVPNQERRLKGRRKRKKPSERESNWINKMKPKRKEGF
jgi:hypothetical protein